MPSSSGSYTGGWTRVSQSVFYQVHFLSLSGVLILSLIRFPVLPPQGRMLGLVMCLLFMSVAPFRSWIRQTPALVCESASFSGHHAAGFMQIPLVHHPPLLASCELLLICLCITF